MKSTLSGSPLSFSLTLSIVLLGGESSLNRFFEEQKGYAITKKGKRTRKNIADVFIVSKPCFAADYPRPSQSMHSE
jgi:hypothetical protein